MLAEHYRAAVGKVFEEDTKALKFDPKYLSEAFRYFLAELRGFGVESIWSGGGRLALEYAHISECSKARKEFFSSERGIDGRTPDCQKPWLNAPTL